MSRVKLCRSLMMLRVLLAALFLLTGAAGNADAQTSGEPRSDIETPKYLLQSSLAMTGGNSDAIRQAIEAALTKFQQPGRIWKVENVVVAEQWAVGAIALFDPRAQEYVPSGIQFALARNADGIWSVALPFDERSLDAYNDWLAQIPPSLLDSSDKAILRRQPSVNVHAQATVAVSGYKLPWRGGLTGYVTSNASDHGYRALDFDIQGSGTDGEVVAAKAGTVRFRKDTSTTACPWNGNGWACSWRYANIVVIEHSSTEYSWYMHLAPGSIPPEIQEGAYVNQGDKIGVEGRTGWATGVHLHFHVASSYSCCQGSGDTRVPYWPSNFLEVDFAEYTWSEIQSYGQKTSQNSSGSNPPPLCPQSGGVILYQHADYDCGGAGEGAGYVIRTGSGFQTVPGSFDNRASSIRIPSNWSVRLFEHGYQNSPSVCINAPGDANFTDNYYPGGYSINDTVSAFEVFTAPNCGGGSGGANRPPNTPSPTSPHDWYVARDGRAPTLCWNNPGDPDGDAVQFFAEVFQSARNAQSGWIYDTCWRPAELDGGYFGYQWRVKARDARGAESGWSAVWHFSIEQGPQPPNTNWQASYWDNRELRGGPRVQTNEGGVYLFRRWEWGAPHGLPGDEWSARFVKRTYFPGGWYTFHCQHDDGCRVFVNGQLLVNGWWDSSFEHHSQGINLPTGEHEVKVEYYEKTGFAALEVWWHGPGYLPDPETCDSNVTWCGEYWGNRHLMGRPAIQRQEGSNLDLHWGTGGPHATFPGDNFSSRYWRRPYLECGRYRFHVFADDGVRMWVDDVLRLDEWRDQVASFAFDLDMSEGRHTLRVDHYENDGSAAIRVHWEKLSSCPPQVSIEEASTHYVKPGAPVDPLVRVRVTQGMLDGGRGDALAWVGGDRLGAGSTAQTVQGVVYNGEQHLFTTMSYPGFRMTAPAGEGTYESVWRIRAAGSEVGSPAVIRVIVDNTPPALSNLNVTRPDANTFQITVNAQDTIGVERVRFVAGYHTPGAAWQWRTLGWDTDGSNGWGWTWNVADVPDQVGIAIYAEAWDRAGNGASRTLGDLILDRQPPQTHMLALPPVQESTAIMLNWEAEDAVSGISAFQLQIQEGDRPWQHLAELWPSARRLRLFGTLGQIHRFRMRGIDQAGNAEPYPDVAETETYINPCNGDAYEPDNSRYNPRVLYAGVPQRRTFCGLNDEDWVIFWAEQGKRYIIRTYDLAQTESFSTDTVLSLYGPDNSLIAENDDWGSLASYIEWTPTTTGWHIARVREYLGHLLAGNAVAYTLSFNEARMLYLPSVVRR